MGLGTRFHVLQFQDPSSFRGGGLHVLLTRGCRQCIEHTHLGPSFLYSFLLRTLLAHGLVCITELDSN